MRSRLALALILGLGACVAPSAPPDPFAPVAATPMDAVPQVSAPAEAEPEPETPAPPPSPAAEPPPPEPPALAHQRQECQRSGGQLSPRLPGVYSCVRPTRDAGQRCDAAADCTGLCLARSGTCAPLAPLFGCHEVFTSPGQRETLCTD